VRNISDVADAVSTPGTNPVPRAEYLVGEIRRYKWGMLAAFAVLSIAAGFAYFYFARSNTTAIDSIAVLPFVNANADPDTDWLSDGITESLINKLSQLPRLRVMARTTVFRYKGREADPQKVGHELGVGSALTGRVLQRGDTLVIQADLVDVATGAQLWGERYNRRVSDIFSVQEEIANQISSTLRLRLSGDDQKRLTKRYTDNTEAYQLYLKGRYYWNKRTEETIKRGIDYFQQAIDKDPNYALAYAGLADSYVVLQYYSRLAPQELQLKAKDAARKALELDDTLAEAHNSLGSVFWDHDWDIARAEEEFKRAIDLNPNYASAYQWYSTLLSQSRRHEEAITTAKRALDLDPFSLIVNSETGVVYRYARRYDQAINQLQKTIEMDSNFAPAHTTLGLVYLEKGQHKEAIAELRKAIDLSRDDQMLAALGYAYAVTGQKGEAKALLNEMIERSRRGGVSAFQVAIIHTGLGDKDQAFEWLEKAYQQHSGWLSVLAVEPRFDSLREDPRFQDLERRVGLTP
jgi:TolB-like protein/Tfp pilus assembly protein PilF